MKKKSKVTFSDYTHAAVAAVKFIPLFLMHDTPKFGQTNRREL